MSRQVMDQTTVITDDGSFESETELAAGLSIILDYLNHGNGVPAVNSILQRADRWVVDHLGRTGFVPPPQRVLEVYPNFFNLNKLSHQRLDSEPPELVHNEEGEEDDGSSDNDSYDDDDESDEEDYVVSVEGDESRRRSSIDDNSSSSSNEEFPPYEDLLLQEQQEQQLESAARRLARRCDCQRWNEVVSRAADQLNETLVVASGSNDPSVFRVGEFWAITLLDSPVLYHIPELLAHMRSLPPLRSAPSYAVVAPRRRRAGHAATDRDALPLSPPLSAPGSEEEESEEESGEESEEESEEDGDDDSDDDSDNNDDSDSDDDDGNNSSDGGLQSPTQTSNSLATATATAASPSSSLKRPRTDEEESLVDQEGRDGERPAPAAKRYCGLWNLWGYYD